MSSQKLASDTHPEPEKIETIDDVIQQLQHHRQTHILWLEYYDEYPQSTQYKYAGDRGHHQHIINNYDDMIELLITLK